MSEKIERRVIVDEEGNQKSVERVVVDESLESRRTADQVASFIWVLFGLLIGALGLRFALKLIGANPENAFASALYQFTELFLWPFFGITGTPSAQGMVFEIPTLIAIAVYALVAWAIVKLVWLMLYRA